METATDLEIAPKRCFFVSFVFLNREYTQSVKAWFSFSSAIRVHGEPLVCFTAQTVYSFLRRRIEFCQYPYKAHLQWQKNEMWCWVATERLWQAIQPTLLPGWHPTGCILCSRPHTYWQDPALWVIIPVGQRGLVQGNHTIKECTNGNMKRMSEEEKDFGIP